MKEKSQAVDALEVPVQSMPEPETSVPKEAQLYFQEQPHDPAKVSEAFREAFADSLELDEVNAQREELDRTRASTAEGWLEKEKALEALDSRRKQLSLRLHIGTPFEEKPNGGFFTAPQSKPELKADLLAKDIADMKLGKPRIHRDLLAPLMEKAAQECDNDAAQMFSLLREWAVEQRPPLLGVTSDGIQWVNAKDETKELSLKNLSDRLRRALDRDSAR